MGWADADWTGPWDSPAVPDPAAGPPLCGGWGRLISGIAGAVDPPVDGCVGGHGVGEGVPTPSGPEPALSHDWGLEVMPRDLL